MIEVKIYKEQLFDACLICIRFRFEKYVEPKFYVKWEGGVPVESAPLFETKRYDFTIKVQISEPATALDDAGVINFLYKLIVRELSYKDLTEMEQEALADAAVAVIREKVYPNTVKAGGSPEQLSRRLPAMNEMVKCPDKNCIRNSGNGIDLWHLIQHINDDHKWSRNAIADWLESLDIDLEFKNV